ncbi:MAG: aminotransferase class V-fold PLP-dependent enzyme [Alphaproteobacteria bacterium]|nr:aminotransferase class V-fold PLP-dependent enzyme [Alphaproteobacteria bacterium]
MDAIPTTRAEALEADSRDPLSAARTAFDLSEGVIYLDGNSLGPPTRLSLTALERTARQEWRIGLVRSWNDAGWIDLAANAGAKIAGLIGVDPGETVVCDSVTVNLHKLAIAMARRSESGPVIVEADEFPTDQYVAKSVADLLNTEFVRVESGAGGRALAQRGGVLVKSVVNYRTAAVADLERDEEAAHQGGGSIVWDLSHATGAVKINLKAAGARAAAGCTYKFLNAGPGAPAFLFVDASISVGLTSPIPGWMGHAAPFEFDAEYRPADGVRRFACGTPPILSLASLDAALSAFQGVAVEDLERKVRNLGDLCLARAETLGLQTVSPPVGSRRGGHVSLCHDDAYAVVQSLIARGVIGDFRAPNLIRFGFSPLFVRRQDVWDAMDALAAVLASAEWDSPRYRQRAFVT